MFFSEKRLTLQIIDVLKIDQSEVSQIRKHNLNRPVSALSYRMDTDAVITSDTQQIKMSSGTVAFFPTYVDYLREATHDHMIVIHLNAFDYHSKSIDCIQTNASENIQQRFAEMYDIWKQSQGDSYNHVMALLYSLLETLNKEYINTSKQYSPLVQTALSYIANHYTSSSLTVADVARKVFISEVYLRRLFMEELHQSPKQYITSLRMKHAISLLHSGYYSVKEVAHACGYEDEKYFSVSFKKLTGKQPSHSFSSTP